MRAPERIALHYNRWADWWYVSVGGRNLRRHWKRLCDARADSRGPRD